MTPLTEPTRRDHDDPLVRCGSVGAGVTATGPMTDRVYDHPRPKVLCVGLGKTGTKTLASCMRQLGFNHLSMHGTEEFARKDYEALLAKAESYDSFDDFPWAYLHEMFDTHFSDVRFILTTRKDVETWYSSLCKHYCRVGPTHTKKIFYGYHSPYENPDHHKELYLTHNAKIRDYFAGRDDFLQVCWETGDGWDTLCSFLGLPIPDAPFPVANAGKIDFDYEAAKVRADVELEKLKRDAPSKECNSMTADTARSRRAPASEPGPSPGARARSPAAVKPRMLDDEIRLLSRHFTKGAHVLEFGCGGSTLLALGSEIARCHSVETDREWIAKLRSMDEIREAEACGRLVLQWMDIGPTRMWGMPTDRSRLEKWPSYFLDTWGSLEREPDVVLIDGRFRTACALVALAVCPASTSILIHDFYSPFPIRKNYRMLLEIAEVVDQASDLVSIKRKDSLPPYKCLPYLSKVLFDYG